MALEMVGLNRSEITLGKILKLGGHPKTQWWSNLLEKMIGITSWVMDFNEIE
jgi:hypothetical protein